jgi:serine/threonine-protein kinase RsbW/stage II sporulation protein AB (anti-sigma F factor)
MELPEDTVDAVALAVSEAATNAIEHAYAGAEPGLVRMRCTVEGDRLVVEIADDGAGVVARRDSGGLGHGMAAIGAMAHSLDVRPGPGGRGSVLTMSFGPTELPAEAPGLEPLCDLAVETVADVSCVDVVHGGVLRRAAAVVANDDALTEWLRQATPPAKPGTATWAAMREGGPHLVVHDPTVPRSPGGTGERLGLTWWVSVPLDGALWGFGGREGGRPVPSEETLAGLVRAAGSR